MQKELPDHYRPWMEIANRLPHLIGSHQLRAQVNEMPLLNCQLLTGYREQRLAHLVLTFITMGYVWQDGEAQPKEVGTKGHLSCHLAGLLHLEDAVYTVCLESGSFLVLSFGYDVKEGQRAHLNENTFFPWPGG
eukprot:bmy_06099T0